ncbi:MAG: hypothetical protein ACWGOX_01250 [Desulforhopalus sp.]
MTSILIVEENPAELRLIKESLNKHRNHCFDCVEADSLQSAFDIVDGPRQPPRMELGKAILNSVDRKKVEQEKKDLLHDLDNALRRVEFLENLLPLCPSCNKIYGADNKWHQLEACSSHFVVGRTSQCICPDCFSEILLEEA